MAAIKEYKCPCCGGAVEFDSKIQKIKCPYCDTEFDTEAFTAKKLFSTPCTGVIGRCTGYCTGGCA